MREPPLVVGVDGSEPSLQAVDWAVDEAALHDMPLRLVHASLWERYEGLRPSFTGERPPGRVMAEHIAASAVERAGRRNPAVEVASEVFAEDAGTMLLRQSDTASMIIVGSRGRGELAGVLLGSVGLAVAARARCPVLVVRGDQPNRRGTFGRIVLGVGDMADGPAAVFAFREAEARGSELLGIRAWRFPVRETASPALLYGDSDLVRRAEAMEALDATLDDLWLEYPRVRVRAEAVQGPTRKVLLDAAATADLLVVGAHRRTGSFGLQLGLVSHTVLHYARCPVAVVPQAR